ncbi:hypothetical protein [Tahibacter amnicola]|uniref:Uncharacterized protein n=1 Tax=Tahibacter amnicola TaxID=2976241 RepID=A0ABY6B8X8_9GAMM|nr:hypothetical protein [Tahibacter amnicola]UXI66513.1 hypothetical protein N4264_17385 [Tahibacter amnicola]
MDTVGSDRVGSQRRNARLAGSGLALLAGLCAPATAQQWGGSLGMATDNVQRGRSLSSGLPAWLADAHYSGERWLFGLGATAERPPGQKAGVQLAAYADRRFRLGDDWAAKLGVVHYESPRNRWEIYSHYDEAVAAVGYRDRWRMSVAVSPNQALYDMTDYTGRHAGKGKPRGFYRRGTVVYAEATWHQPLFAGLSLELGAGYADVRPLPAQDYAYGNAGLSYALGDVTLYTSLLWTNSPAMGTVTKPMDRRQWVTTVLWSF